MAAPAVFEAAFLDRYSILASPARVEFVSRVREFMSIDHDEYTDDKIAQWANAALRRLGADFQWDTLKNPEYHAVVLITAISVCEARMNNAAKYFSTSSRAGSTNPGERVQHNIQAAQELREQLERYVNSTGVILGSEGILQGTLVRYDPRLAVDVPFEQKKAPDPLLLTSRGSPGGAGTVDIVWSEYPGNDFGAYMIYYDTKPKLCDPTRRVLDPNRGFRADVTLLETIIHQKDTGRRIQGLVSGSVIWVCIGGANRNGIVTPSNEIEVVVP